jgi:hypothetical protein
MFRISLLELVVACGLVTMVIIVPLIVLRTYASLNDRLKAMEKKLLKKK